MVYITCLYYHFLTDNLFEIDTCIQVTLPRAASLTKLKCNDICMLITAAMS